MKQNGAPLGADDFAATPRRVLVVEDERIVARDIQNTLEDLGFDAPAIAANGDDALRLIALHQPDLVMMDINIEGDKDGIETALLARAQFDVPIVFLTAYSDDATLARAREAMPVGFLLKPFEERELLAAIETGLYKHAAERQLRENAEELTRQAEALKRTAQELAESRERLDSTLRSLTEGVIAADRNGNITFLNPVAEQLTGWTREDALGCDLGQVLPLTHEETQRPLESPLARALREEIAHGGQGNGSKGGSGSGSMLTARNGMERPVEIKSSPLRNAAGEVSGVVIAFRDVAEQRTLENRLVHQAFHDPLTGLPNRALFCNRLKHVLSRQERAVARGDGRAVQSDCVAVLFLDMDNFKLVNDSLGHAAGDAMLIEVGERMRRVLRPNDTAARLGGDEFTILIEHVENPTHALLVAERLVGVLQEPFFVYGEQIYSSPSIGIAFSQVKDGKLTSTVDEMLRYADAAMYAAKKRGKACYEVFQESLSEEARHRLELGNQLRQALEREELVLHYQPKVDLSTGYVYGVEALVRWNHPTRGLVMPGDFIPVAEEMGLIVPIGRWVLREACQQARLWQNHLPSEETLAISVNVSARQLQEAPSGGALRRSTDSIGRIQGNQDQSGPECAQCAMQMNVNLSVRQLQHPALVAELAQILDEVGLDPHCLVLEITESVVMEEAESTVAVLRSLKDLGVRLAIDDFGTGYSSLAYLKLFPLDFLKIDRKFVMGVAKEDDYVILHSMIALAHALNLTVIAEGAEQASEVEVLRSLGCDLAQGYFFAHPMSSSEVTTFMQDSHAQRAALPAAPDVETVAALTAETVEPSPTSEQEAAEAELEDAEPHLLPLR